MAICSKMQCGKPAHARGLCPAHYQAARKTGLVPKWTKDPIARFLGRIDRRGPIAPNGLGRCWLWTGSTSHGYGQTYIDGRVQKAHRVAYELLVGPIPEDLQLDHLCRVRCCVNPNHLEPVTGRVNLLRGTSFVAENAVKTHCVNGHEFTSENTRILGDGRRACRACGAANQRRYRQRQRLSTNA